MVVVQSLDNIVRYGCIPCRKLFIKQAELSLHQRSNRCAPFFDVKNNEISKCSALSEQEPDLVEKSVVSQQDNLSQPVQVAMKDTWPSNISHNVITRDEQITTQPSADHPTETTSIQKEVSSIQPLSSQSTVSEDCTRDSKQVVSSKQVTENEATVSTPCAQHSLIAEISVKNQEIVTTSIGDAVVEPKTGVSVVKNPETEVDVAAAEANDSQLPASSDKAETLFQPPTDQMLASCEQESQQLNITLSDQPTNTTDNSHEGSETCQLSEVKNVRNSNEVCEDRTSNTTTASTECTPAVAVNPKTELKKETPVPVRTADGRFEPFKFRQDTSDFDEIRIKKFQARLYNKKGLNIVFSTPFRREEPYLEMNYYKTTCQIKDSVENPSRPSRNGEVGFGATDTESKVASLSAALGKVDKRHLRELEEAVALFEEP